MRNAVYGVVDFQFNTWFIASAIPGKDQMLWIYIFLDE